MSNLIDICFVCLQKSNNLVLIKSQDTNGTSIEDKLQYFLPELEFKSNISIYICVNCGRNLNISYEFKQKCLQNITAYEKYAQQITTTDSCKKEDENTVHIEELMIKEEINEELVLDNESKLLLHEIKKEKTESDETCNKTDNLEQNVEYYQAKLYKCEICNKAFKFTSCLKRHKLIHTNNRPYTCKICNRSFRRLTHLEGHQITHTSKKPFTCDVCNKSFRQSSTLKSHKMEHTGKKPHTCEVCQKSFSLSRNFKQHCLRHTDEKPFTCEVCNKSFRQASTLKKHKAVHTDEKPFTCEVCNKSFRRLDNLKSHKVIHTGEKPYTCEICNQSFSQSSSLKSHRLVHTGDKSFVCEFCNKSITFRGNLQQYLTAHKFKCEAYAEKFTRKSALEKHIFEIQKNNDLKE